MEKHAEAAGRIILGLGALGLGLLSLIFKDFAITWQPVPDWVPARVPLAYASGALLSGAGLLLILGRFAPIAAAALSGFMCVWALLLQPARLLAGEPAAWLAPAEILAVAAGAWTFAWGGVNASPARAKAIEAGCAFFGLMAPVFGVAHFLYIPFTASMIPAFIPWRVFWAWFTGAAHIAAGLSITTRIVPHIGAAMLALMMSGFVLLVHLPRVASDATVRLEWHLMSTALLLTGAAWIVAAALWRFRNTAKV